MGFQGGKQMGKWIRRFVVVVLLGIFLYSVTTIAIIMYQYKVSDELYESTASQFTVTHASAEGEGTGTEGEAPAQDTAEIAPISVDFAGLQAVNGDVCGWIYCEDTPINYPVVHGEDNDFYLMHNYDGTDSASGSIFMEADNRPGFADSNTIIYGHHMKNGSMFATLDKWAEQEYYEGHSVMWLLTPEQDYKIVLFSGYTTSANSDTYMIFDGACGELDDYLAKCKGQSDFDAEVELEGDARYVLLSTCAYVFDNARYVLHGKLVPADSAGGRPLR